MSLECELCSREAIAFYTSEDDVAMWHLCGNHEDDYTGMYKRVTQEEYELILLKEAL